MLHVEDSANMSLFADNANVRGFAFGCDPLGRALAKAKEAVEELDALLSMEGAPAFDNPGVVGRYVAARLRGRKNEAFLAAFLTTRHRLICAEELFYGSVDGADVYPRVIAQRALEVNAAAIIVAHNHPSGNPEPSAADMALTKRLKDALRIFDIRLLDHFIVGEGGALSMASKGCF